MREMTFRRIFVVLMFFVALSVFYGCSLNHTKVVAGNSQSDDIAKRILVNEKVMASIDAMGNVLTSKETSDAKNQVLANTLKLSDELANVGSDHVEYYFNGRFTSAGDAAHLFRATSSILGKESKGEKTCLPGTKLIGTGNTRNDERERRGYVKLSAINLFDRDVKFDNGPFKGIRLEPGTETIETKLFRVGKEYRFKVRECTPGTDDCESLECRVYIGKGRTKPITYKKVK